VANKKQQKHDSTEQPPEDIISEQPVDNQTVVDETVEETVQANATSANSQSDLVAELEAEVEANRQGWQRTLAEFQNYKRRTEREQVLQRQRSKADYITQLLPIIDDFDRAMGNLPAEYQDQAWLGGIKLIQDKLIKMLVDNDVTAIEPTGKLFDPTLHQAVVREESETVPSGHVIETLQKGYITGDVLIRPALVKVAN
jgi:molecular chaperone GrpE